MIKLYPRILRVILAAVLGAGLVLPGVAIAQRVGSNATDELNPYSPRFNHPYRRGVTPTREQHQLMRNWRSAHPSDKGNSDKLAPLEKASMKSAAMSGTLSYQGGINSIGVTSGGQPKVYLVFWGNQWGTKGTSGGYTTFTGDPKGAAPYMQKWLAGLGTSGELWSAVLTQYCDGAVAAGATSCPTGSSHIVYPSGGVLAGIWYDNASAAPKSATGNQIAQEAIKAAAYFGNITPASNRDAQYIVMSPTGTNPDSYKTGGFCAWHDYNGDTTLSGGAAPSTYGDIAFTNMPYVADAGGSCGAGFIGSDPNSLQGFSIIGGHEYAETLTDQNPAGGWINAATGDENADECAWIASGQGAIAAVSMATGSFAMQSSWSNDTNRCDLTHQIISPAGGTPTANFTWSAVGGSVNFTDTSTDDGGVVGSFQWNFGDATSANMRNPVHNYTRSGAYTVTETVTDSASGKVATKTQSVLVTIVNPVTIGVLTNGDFESSGGWSATPSILCTNSSCPGQKAHAGSGFAWLDGYGSSHSDTMSQTIVIPTGKKSATLNFYLHIDTLETTKRYQYDTLTVAIKSGANTSILATYSNLNAASNYVFKSLAIPSSYLGKTDILVFTGSEDSSLATSFVIDDVSIAIQ